MAKENFNRRSFLRLGALTGMAAGLMKPGLAQSAESPSKISEASGNSGVTGVKSYSTLGKTGLEISDISFGSSRLRDGEEKLVHHALDRGVNYFDTAESYTGSSAESVLGNALRGARDKVFIATKSSVGSSTSAKTIMETLEESLTRLRTDYVDIYFNHAVNSLSRLKNPEWLEFVNKAKQQGKIRFTGMSGHAGRLAECLDYALDEELFDVILVATNFGEDPAFYEKFTRSFDLVARQPELPRVLEKAKKKNIGVIAMKVLRGARLNDMKPFEKEGSTYAQAAFRWILNNPNVDASIISMTSMAEIDEYLGASGTLAVTDNDIELLQQYARMTDASYCRPSCNDCDQACPYDVNIAEVLRTRMYATDYGDLEFAKTEYQALAGGASACLSCNGQPCQNACSYGLPISKLCGPTHEMLA